MREKTEKVLLTFERTIDAIAMEMYAEKAHVPGRLIPVPASISAGCGMCWVAEAAEKEAVESAVTDAGLAHGVWYERIL